MAGELIHSTSRPKRRLAGLVLLLAAVVLAHSCVTDRLADAAQAYAQQNAMPERIQVSYVREMELATPPAQVALAAAAKPELKVVAPPLRSDLAEAPQPAASQPEPEPSSEPESKSPDETDALAQAPSAAASAVMASASTPADATGADAAQAAASQAQLAAESAVDVAAMAAQASAPQAVAQAASAPSAASAPISSLASTASAGTSNDPAAVPFEWPSSTRLSYALTGNFRGEVRGQAQVEWVHVDNRYQVHLDVTVGMSFAPLMSRQMSSDGEITPDGLSPKRYDQLTKLAFQNPNRAVVLFESGSVLLSNGQRRARVPGVQDTASQFVQLSWLFATQPQRLQVGQAIEVPLALPRNISTWVYEVREQDTVYTPFGEIAAFHLVPLREARGGDLTTELWIAPQLRYLPVRFRIHQDSETWVDLMLTRKPELADPLPSSPSKSNPKETPP